MTFDKIKEIVKNNKAIEDLFKELKQEFATNNKFLRYLIENQKYANEVYERMIEKTLSELRLEMIDLKEKYNQMYNEMQNNMKMISSEWDKKLKKVQNNYESIITDIETKQKYDIDTMKTKYEIESQKNIEEIAKLKEGK